MNESANSSNTQIGMLKSASRANVNNTTIKEISITGNSSLYIVQSNDQTVFMNTNAKSLSVIGYVEGRVDDVRKMPPPILDYLGFFEGLPDDCYLVTEQPYEDYDFIGGPEDGGSRWPSIEPLLRNSEGDEVNWDQDHPYNIYCRSGYKGNRDDYNGRVSAGCGPVAMAQVMWYWQWPPAILTDGHVHIYKWENMPVDLRWSIQNKKETERNYLINQVASLINHCVQRCNISYLKEPMAGSFCFSKDIANAYTWYFNYNAYKKICTNNTKHEKMIIDNLMAGIPVLAEGLNSKIGHGGAHHFIIDGWKRKGGKNLFHINWGWGVQKPYYADSYCFWCRVSYFKTGTGAVYQYFKRFIYNIYPSWMKSNTPKTLSNRTLCNFQVAYKKEINLVNVRVPSGCKGFAISGDYVYLGPGCRFEPGCEVYIGTREMKAPWERNVKQMNKIRIKYDTPIIEEELPDTISNFYASTLLRTNAKLVQPSSNPNVLVLSCEDGIKETYVYSVTGQFVKRVSSGGVGFLDYDPVQQEIDITELSTGVYLVVVMTMGGNRLQDRFVKR